MVIRFVLYQDVVGIVKGRPAANLRTHIVEDEFFRLYSIKECAWIGEIMTY